MIMQDKSPKEVTKRLLPFVKDKDIYQVHPIPTGGNNRLYLLATAYGNYVMKRYFKHDYDKSDRLHREYAFSSFVWSHGIKCIAEPIAQDSNSNVGIYRFIEGSKLGVGDISANAVEQAVDFFLKVNRHKSDVKARRIPYASEACFSIEQYINAVDERMEKLKVIEAKTQLDKEARRFINSLLVGRWIETKNKILRKAKEEKLSVIKRIPASDIILSPSDFGFHNAIMGEDGVIRFIDFEYAGWDDIAKMTCDFFSQVAIPISPVYFKQFVNRLIRDAEKPNMTLNRIRLLLPLHGIKWCCILLNHFLSVDRERKIFADKKAMEKKAQQLRKAKAHLHSLAKYGKEGIYGIC